MSVYYCVSLFHVAHYQRILALAKRAIKGASKGLRIQKCVSLTGKFAALSIHLIDSLKRYVKYIIARFNQSPNDQTRSHERQNGGEPRRKYLLFGGIGSPYLGLQVFGIVILAFGFTCLSVFGIRLALDDPNRQGRLLGWAILSVGLLGGLLFWGWGWTGHPLRAWGLGG